MKKSSFKITSLLMILSTLIVSGCSCNNNDNNDSTSETEVDNKYTVDIDGFDSNQGYVEGNGKYDPDSIVYIKAIPYDGYEFDSWEDGDTTNPRKIIVNSDRHFVPRFKQVNLQLDYIDFTFKPLPDTTGGLIDPMAISKLSLENLEFSFEDDKRVGIILNEKNEVLYDKTKDDKYATKHISYRVGPSNNKFIYKTTRDIEVYLTVRYFASIGISDIYSEHHTITLNMNDNMTTNSIFVNNMRYHLQGEHGLFSVYLKFIFSKIDN